MLLKKPLLLSKMNTTTVFKKMNLTLMIVEGEISFMELFEKPHRFVFVSQVIAHF